ncbi:hypothetical protein EG329_007902 [Mollisiaceae sp. DMI_Dod_QoI]|nr:hypothetical protein EG329_007902 [Helotiales sp. DMI_Dod_QoI]
MINTVFVLILSGFLVRGTAEKFRKFSLPIAKMERILPSFPNQYEGIQRPLSKHTYPKLYALINDESSTSRGYPSQNFVFYTTNLSIGTPPQPFRTIIDLNWSDLFLPSSTCESASSRWCNPSNATYNASASFTYRDNGTITRIAYGPVYAYPRLSEDILTFADGLQVPGQVFHEIKYYEKQYGEFGAEYFDGVLGLAINKPWLPGGQGELNILPSPFRNMIDHNVLDSNMFSIVWPTEAREHGNLMFGGYDEDLLDGELVSHSLFPENTTKWQIEIEGVSMVGSTDGEGKKFLVDNPIPDGRAFFMSSVQFLAFSYYLTESLMRYMPNWPSACYRFRVVDCDKVSSFPEFVFRFKGQNVTLRGEDYVRRLPTLKNCPSFGDECHLMLDYLGEIEDLVILGMPFLEKLMGVWNWDEKTISFGELKE